MIDTKERVLAAAERLFGQQGYAATSLRHVIAEAGVNLAAIHYHFGSKEDLLAALVARFADPVNRERIAMLDRLEAEASDDPLEVERILEAFLVPPCRLASVSSVRLMGRLYGEGLMPSLVERHFRPTGKRFVQALRRVLPDITDEEFFWRVDFMIGSMAHVMVRSQVAGDSPQGTDEPPDISPGSRGARRLACLVAFLSAGFRAPAAVAEERVEAVR